MPNNHSIHSYTPINILTAIKRGLAKRGIDYQRTSSPTSTPVAGTVTQELAQAAVEGRDVLFKTDTVFPFTLFPDTITLDREKFTFTNRIFFFVSKVISVPVRDILNVEADYGPFFGSVHTSSRYFITSPITVNFLWRSDAIKLQRLLQGLIIVQEKEIDISNVSTPELLNMLTDLGKGES